MCLKATGPSHPPADVAVLHRKHWSAISRRLFPGKCLAYDTSFTFKAIYKRHRETFGDPALHTEPGSSSVRLHVSNTWGRGLCFNCRRKIANGDQGKVTISMQSDKNKTSGSPHTSILFFCKTPKMAFHPIAGAFIPETQGHDNGFWLPCYRRPQSFSGAAVPLAVYHQRMWNIDKHNSRFMAQPPIPFRCISKQEIKLQGGTEHSRAAKWTGKINGGPFKSPSYLHETHTHSKYRCSTANCIAQNTIKQ